MRVYKILAIVAAFVLISAVNCWAGTFFETGFESPYVLGDLDGQETWVNMAPTFYDGTLDVCVDPTGASNQVIANVGAVEYSTELPLTTVTSSDSVTLQFDLYIPELWDDYWGFVFEAGDLTTGDYPNPNIGFWINLNDDDTLVDLWPYVGLEGSTFQYNRSDLVDRWHTFKIVGADYSDQNQLYVDGALVANFTGGALAGTWNDLTIYGGFSEAAATYLDNISLTVTPVPEPVSLMALSSGLLSMGALAVRKRRES